MKSWTKAGLAAVLVCVAMPACSSHAVEQTDVSRPSPAPSTSAPAHYGVPPRDCGPVTPTDDGNAREITCPDGAPRLAAVNFYEPLAPRILGLSAAASAAAIRHAICADETRSHATPIEAGEALWLNSLITGRHLDEDDAVDKVVATEC